MAMLANDVEGFVDADESSAIAALDYASRHYLNMPADVFLKLWDSGVFSEEEVKSNRSVARVVEMLSMLRPEGKESSHKDRT